MSSLELIVGPMFSGKTTRLIELLNDALQHSQRVIAFKHDFDDRYSSTEIRSHNQKSFKAISCSKLSIYFSTAIKYDCIGIDEAQFFPDIIEFCKDLLALGKRIIVEGLDGTFERKPFGKLLNLLPYATSFKRLTSKCPVTGNSAPFTQRLISSTEKIVIGGSESYRPISRSVLFPGSGKLQLFIENIHKKSVSPVRIYKSGSELQAPTSEIEFQNEKGFAAKCDVLVRNGSNIDVFAKILPQSSLPDELRILIPLCDQVSYQTD